MSMNATDRFLKWSRERAWRQVALALVVVAVAVPLFLGLMFLIIILSKGSSYDVNMSIAANWLLVGFVALCVPFFQRAMYRRLWHLEHRQHNGSLRPEDPDPEWYSEYAPPPKINWPWPLRLRHALFHLVGIASLLFVFMPYQNYFTIEHYLRVLHENTPSLPSIHPEHLAGVTLMVFIILPLLLLGGLAMLLTYRRNSWLLDERTKFLLKAERIWLFSFSAGFIGALNMCWWVSQVVRLL